MSKRKKTGNDDNTAVKGTKKPMKSKQQSTVRKKMEDDITPMKRTKNSMEEDMNLCKGSKRKRCVDVFGTPRGRLCTFPCDPNNFQLTFNETHK